MKSVAIFSVGDSDDLPKDVGEDAPREVRIIRKGRLAVAVPTETSEPLTAETVRHTQEAVRAERGRV